MSQDGASSTRSLPTRFSRTDRRGPVGTLLRVGLIATLLALFARTFLVEAVQIPSPSMAPTLEVGDHILVNRFIYGPARYAWERDWLPLRPVRAGDVVSFRSPGAPELALVKRCVATGGQRLAIRGKQLYLDGSSIDESGYKVHSDPRTYRDSPFLEDQFRRRDHLESKLVPAGAFFVLGDHRDLSHDSRFWGTAAERTLRGRLLFVYWNDAGPAAARQVPRWVR